MAATKKGRRTQCTSFGCLKKITLAGSGLVFWLLSIQLFKLLSCPGHSVGCAAKLGLNTSDHYFHGILQIWSFWEGLKGLSLCWVAPVFSLPPALSWTIHTASHPGQCESTGLHHMNPQTANVICLQLKLYFAIISFLVLCFPPIDILVYGRRGRRHVRNSLRPQSGGLHCVYSRNSRYSKYYSVKKGVAGFLFGNSIQLFNVRKKCCCVAIL